MKKLILSLLIGLFISTSVLANEIEVVPTMQSKTNAQDRVWCATFQLVWNDLMDKIVHHVIKFPEGTPEIVKELNEQEFVEEDISVKSFYKYCGRVKKNTKKQIVKALKKRFNETSDIIDKLDLKPNSRQLLVYTMLKKDFNFVRAFDKLGKSDFRDTQAEFFGINKDSDTALDKGVNVLFYNSSDDFAVMLETQGKDEVYLYKTAKTKPFKYIYDDMLKKQDNFTGVKYFQKSDELKVPNLKFFEEKSYDELANNRIKGTQLVIEKAMQTVEFEMNNKGVELKSEAAITVMTTALMPTESRLFYFDDTFVMFLKEKDKTKPYFALRVYDISKYQK